MHGPPDDADGASATDFAIREVAALRQVPVLGDGIACVGADGADAAALRAIDDGDRLLRHGRHSLYAAELAAQFGNVTNIERLCRGAGASRPKLTRADEQHIAAELGHLDLDLLGGAVADGDHGDHGGDADDDAEQREERAQGVAPDGLHRELQGLVEHQAAFFARVSLAILPSRKWTTRPA